MLKFLSSGLLILALATNALAETVKFGLEDDLQFTVEKPEDWEAKNSNSGVQLISSDEKTSIAFNVIEKKNVTIDDMQQVLPSKLGLTEVKKQERKRLILISGVLEGTPIQIQLSSRDDCLITIVSAGEDKKSLKDCVSSLRRAEITPSSDNKDK